MFEQTTPQVSVTQELAPIPNQQTDFEAWLAWKLPLIGGNPAGVIAGVSKHMTLPQLFDRIVHGLVDRKSEEDLAFLAWRSKMEDPIAQTYTEITGRKIRRTQSAYFKQDPRVIISPDRHILLDKRGVGIHEIKSRRPEVWHEIAHDGAPEADWVQTQHYLMGSGSKWGAVTQGNVESGKQINIDVEADPEFHALLWERIQAFLVACDKRERPTVDYADPMRVPLVGGTAVKVEEQDAKTIAEFAFIVNNFEIAAQLEKDSKALYALRKGELWDWMTGHGFGEAEAFGRRVYAREDPGRKTFNKETFQAEHPDIDLDEFQKVGAPIKYRRVFQVKSQVQADLPALIEANQITADNNSANEAKAIAGGFLTEGERS